MKSEYERKHTVSIHFPAVACGVKRGGRRSDRSSLYPQHVTAAAAPRTRTPLRLIINQA